MEMSWARSRGLIQMLSRRTVEGLFGDVADADGHDLGAVFVGIQTAQGFAKYLAEAIAAVGPGKLAVIDGFIAAVKSHGVIAAGEYDALDALDPGRLEQIARADSEDNSETQPHLCLPSIKLREAR